MPADIPITAEMIAEAEEWAALGMWPTEIADGLGIADRTLRVWRQRGREEGEGARFDLDAAIRRGEHRCRRGHLVVVTRAAKDGHVGASQWVLERRFGWASRSKVEHGIIEEEAPVDREALAEWVAAKLDATDEE